jgi:excisionase family DNA binding protein
VAEENNRPPSAPENRLRTTPEAAARLNVCCETVRRLHRAKKLPAVPGIRKLLFSNTVLNEFIGKK